MIESKLAMVVTKPEDRNGHEVLTLSAATIKASLKEQGITGKVAQQKVRDTLREQTGGANDAISRFVRSGGEVKSVRFSKTKDGRDVLTSRFETPKVSEIEMLRSELAKAIAANEALQLKNGK